MDKLGTLLKIAALAGGALAGVLLARWCDEWLLTQAHEKSEYDKSRYAQGLAPLPQNPLQQEHLE